MNYFSYIRQSRAKAGGRVGISWETQRDEIEKWAAYKGHTIVGEYAEHGSGARTDRPEFLKMLAAIERGEAQGVVVMNTTRLGRSVVGTLEALDRIKDAGAEVASVKDDLDTSTDTGQLVLKIMLSIAEFELSRIRGNWFEANTRAIKRGVHIAPGVPLGYSKDEDGRLSPNGQADVIKTLYARRAEGESWSSLARWLNDVAPPDEGRWTRSAVRELASRRVYLGIAHWGEHENTNAHSALVDEATWQRAQAETRTWTKATGDDVALLNGLTLSRLPTPDELEVGPRQGAGLLPVRRRRQGRLPPPRIRPRGWRVRP
jgi:DNA invertase Pin-like site-specific DNA recombinase